MASLKPALSEDEVKKIGGIANLRKAYYDLAKNYNRIMNGDVMYCHYCNDFHNSDSFYNDKRFSSGVYPTCKKKLILEATDYDKKTNTYVDNREKTINVFRQLDIPFYDSLYNSSLSSVQNSVGEKNRQTAYQHMLTIVKSLPQYKDLHFCDSEFDDKYEPDENEIKVNEKTIRAAKKRFGMGYSNEDLMFLENQYQDWVTRYECNSKAQEEIFERLSFKKLEINKATKAGQPTKDLDKTYQDWLGTANIQPRQSGMDTLADAQTFGTLLKKYEETRPLPDIDPELEDVDKIGTYIDVFFKGHLSKSFGLKNNFSHIYEKYIKQFTVNKPQYDEEADSEVLFDKIFGSSEE